MKGRSDLAAAGLRGASRRAARPGAWRRGAFIAGGALLAGAWLGAAAGHGMTVHMLAHMTSVAVAAPLLAFAMAGTRADLALRLPHTVMPLPMSVVELVVVWSWHAPAARAFANDRPWGLALEQAMFAAAGLLLWSACLGARDRPVSRRRASGVLALLLTTMHMTLLGVLIALAPRPLFGTVHAASPGTLDPAHFGMPLSPLEDQQLGGVIMLVVGAGSYLLGALVLLGGLLRASGTEAPQRCS